MKQIACGRAIVVFMLGLLWAGWACAGVEKTQVMALSALDGRAVVKTTDGKMRVLYVGDMLTDGVVVKQVLADRLVVEEIVSGNPPRRETVWIYRAIGGKSRVQRFDRQGPSALSAVREGVRSAPSGTKAK